MRDLIRSQSVLEIPAHIQCIPRFSTLACFVRDFVVENDYSDDLLTPSLAWEAHDGGFVYLGSIDVSFVTTEVLGGRTETVIRVQPPTR